MIRAHNVARVTGLLLGLASLGLAPSVPAGIVVLDQDGAEVRDFRTTPYLEDGLRTTVDSGHYEILADGGGASGDQAFHLDDQAFGLSQVRLTGDGGSPFDLLSLDVVHPAGHEG